MPVVDLPIGWIIVLDAAAWAFFHLAISFAAVRIPDTWLVRRSSFFRPRAFERNGALWGQLVRVKHWKHLIPDGTMFIRNGYSKQRLHGTDRGSLEQFAVESRRAELTHWLSILPAALFFLWNPIWAAWLNVAYALVFNLPIIIAQRYNRPRLEQLIARKKSRPVSG
ncbi:MULTISPECIES: hypothetical protein [Sporosarcina]|uniref:glycosyl-4,4'-diaponeurosporenoate acyltransferase CrtO family protein n=1 Tax=Sporosarcina TaxID=1569 RepID=UPI0005906A84|nr:MULTISPECIES: hypothetical protein [Sporosarcina]WJY27125.1 glycosyl-4,4'-diaponeurosporenoate acyltransferase [Sporosarcina sp. 0.2-SM1T-5]